MFGRAVFLVCLLLACAGCTPEFFRFETELKSDGRVARIVWQPSLPQGEEQNTWPKSRGVAKDRRLEWDRFDLATFPFQDLPPNANPQTGYWLAGGEFATSAEIPHHYKKPAGKNLPDAELTRTVQRKDYAFVTDHTWEETLTDVVRLEDIPVAQRELVELLIPLGLELLRDELGQDWSLKEAEAWLRDEGAKWSEELLWAYIDLALRFKQSALERSDQDESELFRKKMAEVCRRHSLNELSEPAAQKFAIQKLKQLIRDRDGKELSEERATKLVAIVFGPKANEESQFDKKMKLIIERRFGSQETFQTEHLGPLLVRIVGAHHPLQTSQHFDARTTMPGYLIETNGKALNERTAHWRFLASDASLFGYVMSCKSRESNDAAQQAAFGKVVLKSRAACDEFVAVVKPRDEWIEILRQCAEQESRKPFIDLRKQVLAQGNDADKDDMTKLTKLLLSTADK